MLMPVSSEFVALCRAQIMLLTQALGASISVIYLTQDLVEGAQTQLVPIAAYPETFTEWDRQPQPLRLAAALTPAEPFLKELAGYPPLVSATEDSGLNEVEEHGAGTAIADDVASTHSTTANAHTQMESAIADQRQIVLPLMHESMVFGLLVTQRDDRAWEAWEHQQIERIATTLSLACVMDQRYQWGQQEREQEKLVQLQQRDLMDNLLHQLRNSLTALQTFGKLILRRLVPGDRSYELATSITRETERLRELAQQIELVLDVGLLSTPRALPPGDSDQPNSDEEQLGEATLDPRPIHALPTVGLLPGVALTLERCLVETVLEPLLASATTIAQEKNISIWVSLPDDLPPVWANPQALREVFNNLIENAIKYTPTNGHIWVEADVPDNKAYLEISVSDTGPGIPPDDLLHLFERYYRGVQAKGTIPGTGLGLAIARSLVEQMDGKIQAFSPALPAKQTMPGELPSRTLTPGTTFIVQLPLVINNQEP
ncbi:ATPase, histidine kinase/DNA gyrase B/HSP90-like protein [Leptolyngbyaceae cyanobacterium JSC-12]|nr:ATPase, histidine kinase/DNA gyrase B/HSP90-like protein [Leptolyngbyaceae cyanobacterium JSC-12]